MTLEQFVKHLLLAGGYDDTQADEIVSAMKADPDNSVMSDRWQNKASEYDERFIAVAMLSAAHHAKELFGPRVVPGETE